MNSEEIKVFWEPKLANTIKCLKCKDWAKTLRKVSKGVYICEECVDKSISI